MELRPYQLQALELIRGKYQAGIKKVLLYGMTGFGKTEVFAWVCREVASRGKYVFVVTRGRDLVHNAWERLKRRSVDAGCLMAGTEFEPGKFVYVISIDTLNRRKHVLKNAPDLVVLDEAHFCAAPSFVTLAETYPDAYYLAVTATPWPERSIRHVAGDWVAPATYDELVALGFLVPSKVYAPCIPDLSGVKVLAGDYREADLAQAMDKSYIYGNIVDYYARVTGKAKALCFCVNVQHSKNMAEVFNANGIRAAHLDAGSSDDTRRETLDALKAGLLDVVTNCNILSTGIDLPELRCIVSARPTKSRILWVQQAGRGSRPSSEKSYFFLMDHANNTREHGFIEDFVPPLLDGRPRRSTKSAPPVKTCPACFAVVLAAVTACTACGEVFPRREGEKRELTEIELKEFERQTVERVNHRRKTDRYYYDTYQLVENAITRGYSRGFVFMKLKGLYNDGIAKKYSARSVVDEIITEIEHAYERAGLQKPSGFRSKS